MKKLFSLILMALISSQMWAAPNAFVFTNLDSKNCSSGNSSCGTISGKIGNNTLSSVKGKQTYDTKGKEFTITATASTGYYFYGWEVEYANGYTESNTSTTSSTIKVTPGSIAVHVHAIFKQAVKATFYGYSSYAGATASPTTKLKEVYVKPGETPSYGTPNPTRPQNDEYTYTFKGWSTTQSGSVAALGAITTNKDYYAQFTATKRKYTITFKDGNDDILTSDLYEYGQTPSYTGSTPTKDEDASNTYEWTGGWDYNISAVTGNKTYTAQFNSIPKAVTKYEVNFSSTGTGTLTVKDGEDELTTGDEVNANKTITIELGAGTHYHLSSLSVKDDSDNDVSLTEVTADAKYTFTLTSDVTISAAFEEDAKYTVNITTPVNGTISVMNGSTPVSNGDQVYTGTTLTVTATGDTENHYEFKSWKAGTPALDANNQFTLSSNVTIGANFGLEEFTIRFIVDGTPIQTRSEEWGATPISPNESTVQKQADTYYTYSFAGWDANDDGVVDGVSAVSGDKDYVAVFNRTSTGVIPTYNITIGAYSNGTVTLTAGGDVQVVPTTGGVYSYDEGTTIIVNAIANRGWHFTQWNDANTSKSRQISEIAADITLTPTFATNVSFNMLDTWTQSECASNYNFDDVLTVTLVGRTFTAGQWATLSVPFDYTLTADDALHNSIYKFNNVTLSAGGSSVFLEFVRTNDIDKNQPYLVVPRQAINEVVFDGVKLETPEEQAPTTDDRVAFVSTLWQQTIEGPDEFYIGKQSTLYYAPNSGMTIKGNRAFFRKIGDAASSPAPRRVVIRIDGEDTEMEILGAAEEVRKYMENGILIIERNGVRMDALGNRID